MKGKEKEISHTSRVQKQTLLIYFSFPSNFTSTATADCVQVHGVVPAAVNWPMVPFVLLLARFSGPPPPTPACTSVNGTVIGANNNLPGSPYRKVSTAGNCCTLCQNNADCLAWTWHYPNKYGVGSGPYDCFLHGSTGSRKAMKGVVSGTVQHHGPPAPSPPTPPSPPPPPPPPPPSPPSPPPPSPHTVNAVVNRTVIQSEVSPHFIGVNLDWWLDGCGGEGKDWSNNGSVLLLDLQQ